MSDISIEVVERPSLIIEVVQGIPGTDGLDGSVTSVNGNAGPAVVLTTDNISEGAVNKYFTDERVDDRVNSLLVAGSNITLTYNDPSNTLTIAATGGGGGGAVDSVNGQTGVVVLDSDDISEGSTNLYFSTERAQDAVGAALLNGNGIDLTYDDAGNTITADLDLPGLGSTSSTEGADLMLLYDNSESEHRVITVDDFIAGKGITDEKVRVRVTDTTPGFLFKKITAGNGIAKDVLNPSGEEELEISIDPGVVYDKVLDTSDDIAEGASNLFFTNERAQDAVGSALTDTASIDFTYNDGANTITADLKTTTVGAGSYGSSTQVSTFTVGTDGRLTAASNTSIQSASDTQSGLVELATIAETNTGTDATRAVTPDALSGSYAGTKSAFISVTAPTEGVATGDGKAYVTIPESVNGMNLIRATATVVTAGTTGATTIQIHNVTQAADMLSGLISIASGGTVATAGTIDTANDDVATNDVLRVDVDSISSTAPQGLMVILEFRPQ